MKTDKIRRNCFDIAPFALPNCAPNEVRFEQPRDIQRVVVRFANSAPANAGLSYLQKTWPQSWHEFPENMAQTNPCVFGWRPIDDWFNAIWKAAAVQMTRPDGKTIEFAFEGLHAEFADFPGRDEYNAPLRHLYDVTFRRTLGVRVDIPPESVIHSVEVYTTSVSIKAGIQVELNAGTTTACDSITISGYNVRNLRITPVESVEVRRRKVLLGTSAVQSFLVTLKCMRPTQTQPYSDDDGHVTFTLDNDAFTISLSALWAQGPIWFAEYGVFITEAGDPTTFFEYKERIRSAKTIRQRVLETSEQSLAGAYHGQPRPHAVACTLGCKYARQRFWVEADGDIVLIKRNVTWVPGADSSRFCNDGDARFLLGLGEWISAARFTDPPPTLAYNLHFKYDNLFLEQKLVAVPLEKPVAGAELLGDSTVVMMVRFRLRNMSDRPATTRIPIGYSGNSERSTDRLIAGGRPFSFINADDCLVPRSSREMLSASADGRITGTWHEKTVLRCMYESDMSPVQREDCLMFERLLQPGEIGELILKIPYITIDTPREEQTLFALSFDECESEAREFWREEARYGAQLQTPNPHLNALHTMHPIYVNVTDFSMPGKNRLINTSAGSSTYGNYVNESCMIIQELDQRGLHDEARRRIEVWLEHQSTAGLAGRFSDFNGVFYGAGGFESGESYCQHHGWALWIIGMHYFLTGDTDWLNSVAEKLIMGLEWVFRQRRYTMEKKPPHSRGWEYGFLPAGGLEDTGDYWYWLSTNALTWRGCDTAAAALEAIGHAQAARIRKESDAYKKDLIRGFETMRRFTPLVRLCDGRWVPKYSSRLYCRGRDSGWIRETLEGAVYLLISGLYAPDSPQASWILDDYQDNLYMNPPFGYAVDIPERTWFDRGGLSIQPNLLAGLMPHLDRDEIEVYIWMFFNCWNACYREEITGMVEHPSPTLGFSNSAHFKTSDEANAVMWLRYMFVYTSGTVLFIGKAIPRDWLRNGQCISAKNVATRFGMVSVAYESKVDKGEIQATVNFKLRLQPMRALVRFRHPARESIKSVTINGKPHTAFDAVTGDVDLTGLTGELTIRAMY